MSETYDITTRLRVNGVGQYERDLGRAEKAMVRLDTSSHRARGSLRSLAGVGLGAGASVAVAGLIKSSAQLEASYSRTLAQLAEQTKAPQAEMERLDKLALKMGADTSFGAKDAADAMLQLAKGGLSPAAIEAGALRQTLTLAAAGNIDLATAADTVVQSMGAFQLKANQADQAVSALAGSANASSADVGDMTQALAQVGTSANAAGLSVQDTTAYLALFANQGFKGSDAGTSLRTMLSRLVPQTKEAAAAMDSVGLSYLDANGNLVDAEEIAARTQKAFKGLSDEQKISAVNAIFGADAQRAVNAITAEGVKGFESYRKATSDLGAAQDLANANMKGTAGALERLDGSLETAKIQIGKGIAPAVEDLADRLSDLVDDGDLEGWARGVGNGVTDLVEDVAPLGKSLLDLGQSALPALATSAGTTADILTTAAEAVTPLVEAFNALPETAQQAIVLAIGAQQVNKRLGLTGQLAGQAGGGLVLFGRNADQAGTKAGGKGAGGIKALGASLKSTAALAAGFALIDIVSSLLPEADIKRADELADSIENLQAKSKNAKSDLNDLFEIDGSGMAATNGLQDAIRAASQNKFVDALDTVASGFGIFDRSGDLGKQAVEQFDQALSTFVQKGDYRSAAEGFELFDEKARAAGKSTEDIADLLPDYTSAMAALTKAQQEEANSSKNLSDAQVARNRQFLIGAFGLEQYRDQLQNVPPEVITKIMTPGAIKSAADMRDLVTKYQLSPDLVRTIVEASGIDLTAAEMRDLIGLSTRIDRKRAKARVQAAAQAAINALTQVNNLLTAADRDVVSKVTVEKFVNSTISTTRNRGEEGSTLFDLYSGQATKRAIGGRVPDGYALGGSYRPLNGRVPGAPPADPMRDNILAMGSTGRPLMVRSGEWIVNEKASDANDEWLAAINGGLDLRSALGGLTPSDLISGAPLRITDLLGPGDAFASGGRYDAVSRLELTQMRIRVRDLQRDLRRKEKYKGRDGKQHERLELRGLDRLAARQELDEARDELRGTERANTIARRRHMSPTRYNDYRGNLAEEREEARRTLRSTRVDNAKTFRDYADISSFATSPKSLSQRLQQSIGRMASFTSVLIDLRKKGAAPWLLEQLVQEGPTPMGISLAKKYASDQNALRMINAQAAALGKVSNIYGRVTADPKFYSTSMRWQPAVSTTQTKILKVEASSLDSSSVAREITRQVKHELDLQALSAGLGTSGPL